MKQAVAWVIVARQRGPIDDNALLLSGVADAALAVCHALAQDAQWQCNRLKIGLFAGSSPALGFPLGKRHPCGVFALSVGVPLFLETKCNDGD